MSQPDVPPIGLDEYETRLARVQTAMESAGLDALLITMEVNFRWVTGFVSQSWISPTRPRYCIVPSAGDPIAIIPAGSRVSMQATSWVRDVRTWVAPQPEDDGLSLVRDTIRSCSDRGGRVGCELGPETRLGFPVADFDRLRVSVEPIALVDASALLARLRMIKSAAEIARIRFAAQAVSAGFEGLVGKLRPGNSERSACRALQIDLLERKLDKSPYMIGVAGRGGYDNINSGPTDRVISAGDVFIIDTGSTFDGYFCDFDRNYAFGPPAAPVREAYERVWLATEAGFSVARPGSTASDVWHAMARELGSDIGGSNVGRMGHGLGLLLTEPPSIRPNDGTVLEQGMVITLEPGIGFVDDDGGHKVMVHEENVLITEGSSELLSVRAWREMPVIG